MGIKGQGKKGRRKEPAPPAAVLRAAMLSIQCPGKVGSLLNKEVREDNQRLNLRRLCPNCFRCIGEFSPCGAWRSGKLQKSRYLLRQRLEKEGESKRIGYCIGKIFFHTGGKDGSY